MRSFGYERSRAAALALAGAALAGCPKKAPPVLFHSDVHAVAVDAVPAAALADAAAADVPRFAVVEGAAVEGDGATLTVDGAAIRGAEGERFTRWLRVDLDGDGQSTDVVAARIGADARGRAPAVFRRVAAGYEPVPLVRAEPTDAQCAESAVRQTSPRSVVVSWRCPPGAADGTAVAEEQLLVGLSPTPAAKERASLLAGPLPDTALALRLEGADLDGDGLDEVSVGLAAGWPGAELPFSARVVFFDRAGALARDTSEPAASLQATLAEARRALAEGRLGASLARNVLEGWIRLRRGFCAEGGLARIRFHGATGFDCAGSPPTPGADLYARTLMNLGELPAAEAQLVAETASDLGVVTNERVLADLERLTVVERTATARMGPAAGAELDALAPARSGAVAFNRATSPTGLALRGPASGAVDLATLTLAPGAPGAVADVLASSPDGATRVLGFVDTCAGAAVVLCPSTAACATAPVTPATAALPEGATRRLLGALPSHAFTVRCVREPGAVQGLAARRARVLGWGRDALVVSLDGLVYRAAATEVRPLLLGDAASAPGFAAGSAVSEGGGVLVQPGLGGVWVRERNAWRRWAPEALAGRFAQMTDLTVTNDARAVAGFAGTQLWVLERPRAARAPRR